MNLSRSATTRRSSLAAALALAVCSFASAGNARAACSWEWLCNGEGSCKQMPVCELLDETPPPKPESAPPKPPISMKPQRVTSQRGGDVMCEQVMRQTPAGNWKWDEACFCADAAKAKDPSSPMSNITRCVASE
jgi:hypothetical protein